MQTPIACNFASILRSCIFSVMGALVLLASAGCKTYEDAGRSGIAVPEPGSGVSVGSGMGMAFYSTNVLHEGDVVDVNFQYATNFNTLQRIALDGTLNLNTVGTVRAAGKTLVQMQQDIAKAYESLAKGDVITVNLMMNSVAIVYVAGAVLKPGEVSLDRPLTAIEAVMAAGGFDNSRAKLSEVSVLRIENGQQHSYPVNLRRVLDGKDKTPFYLKPYDIVYVPTKTFNY